MNNPNFAEDEEKPLDPALEIVRRKMVRLLIVSSSVIIIGLMAVVFSIVYKSRNVAVEASPAVAAAPAIINDIVPPAKQAISLPEGFVVESSSISGNRILIFGANQDGLQRIFVHDIATGKPVTEIEIK
jgi:hypothetical protein